MMAKLLRYFSVISLIGLTAIILMLTWLHRQEGLAQLTRLTEHQHTLMAQAVTHIWRSADTAAAAELTLRRRLSTMPLTAISGYDSAGERIFAVTDRSLAVHNEPPVVQAAMASVNRPRSWLEHDFQRVVSIIPLQNSQANSDAERQNILQSSAPAVIALHSDVAPQLASLDGSETHFVKALVALFAVLYGVGVVVSRRLCAILNRQQQSLLCNEKTLREKARQLEQAISQRKQAEQALKAVTGKAESGTASRTVTLA